MIEINGKYNTARVYTDNIDMFKPLKFNPLLVEI